MWNGKHVDRAESTDVFISQSLKQYSPLSTAEYSSALVLFKSCNRSRLFPPGVVLKKRERFFFFASVLSKCQREQTWNAWHAPLFFADRKWPPVLYRKKLMQNWVRPPRPKRDLETDHLRPSNLAARTLSLVEHTLSKFCGDPCPVRRGLAAAVKCCVLKKHVFFAAVEQNERSKSLVWVSRHKGENLFCFLFSDRITVGLMSTFRQDA